MFNPHPEGVSSLERRNKDLRPSVGFRSTLRGRSAELFVLGPERALRAEWREARVTSQHQSKPCLSEDQAIEDVCVPCLLFQNSILTSVSLGLIATPFYWEDRLSFCYLFTMSRTALPLMIK